MTARRFEEPANFAKGAYGALATHFHTQFFAVKIGKLLGFGPLYFEAPANFISIYTFSGGPRPELERTLTCEHCCYCLLLTVTTEQQWAS